MDCGQRTNGVGLVLAVTAMVTMNAMAGNVRLAEKGEVRCVIVVSPGLMYTNPVPPGPAYGLDNAGRRRLLYDSVTDLALYLGKMSGAKVEIVEGLPAGEKLLPIYVGTEAQKVFGKVGASKAGLFGFRVVAGRKGVGLYGESEFGTSYAIDELLHRLGCRWFIPTEPGECIPNLAALDVPEMDNAMAPATEYRGMWNGGANFMRRNRMNGDRLVGGHMLDAFSGYCQPAMFDVTAAVKPGTTQFTILCERKWLNELGTGGLMGPVVLWREK